MSQCEPTALRGLSQYRRCLAIAVLLVVVVLINMLFNVLESPYTKLFRDVLVEPTNLRKNDGKYKTCVMTRVKVADARSSCRVVEWLRYHLLLGFEHIFITDDCSPYPDFKTMASTMGSVTYIPTAVNCTHAYVPDENRLFVSMFEQHTRDSCEWLALFDVDEYITFREGMQANTVGEVLATYPHPFMRLAWWIMGSDGQLESPPGFLVTSYHHGYLQTNHLKTMGKTDHIRSWSFSLFPWPIAHNESKYVTTQDLHSEEKELVNNGTRWLPTRPMFLKHFVYQSFSEFMSGRGKRATTSNNDANYWAVDPMGKWLGGNITTPDLAANFTARMGERMRQWFAANATAELDSCRTFWGL